MAWLIASWLHKNSDTDHKSRRWWHRNAPWTSSRRWAMTAQLDPDFFYRTCTRVEIDDGFSRWQQKYSDWPPSNKRWKSCLIVGQHLSSDRMAMLWWITFPGPSSIFLSENSGEPNLWLHTRCSSHLRTIRMRTVTLSFLMFLPFEFSSVWRPHFNSFSSVRRVVSVRVC